MSRAKDSSTTPGQRVLMFACSIAFGTLTVCLVGDAFELSFKQITALAMVVALIR